MQQLQFWLPMFGICFVPAYFVGAIPFGFLFAKAKGIDIRQHGSGNIGATNVWRTLGRSWGIATFILDFLKVPVAALIVTAIGQNQISQAPEYWRILVFLGGVIGHNYPIWLKFKGGKGIATSAGGVLWLFPLAFGFLVAVWVIIFGISRYVGLASIAAALTLPIVAIIFARTHLPLVIFCAFLCLLAIWRHRGNIQRLIAGTEHRWVKK